MKSSNKIKKLNDNMIVLIDELADQQYHDGTSLGLKLNMSRAAVWKYIQKLIEYGVQIDSVKGKGYLLSEPIQLLNKKKIQAGVSHEGICCEVLEQVDSTNNYLKEYLKNYLLNQTTGSRKQSRVRRNPKQPNIVVCMAESQTQGRGRMQRQWYSPFAKNIYLSVLYPLQKDITELAGLSLVVGLAVAQVIDSCCEYSDAVYVKWPNDIMMNHKKIAGILIDLQAEAHGGCHAIVGIGMNINMKKSNTKNEYKANEIPIDRPWSSLYQETLQYYNRNQICSELINRCIEYLDIFSKHGLNYFTSEWRKRDYLHNQSIKLVSQQQTFSGIGSGIDAQGHLIITTANNTKRSFASGDTRIIRH